MQEILSACFTHPFFIFSHSNRLVTRGKKRTEREIGLAGPRQQLTN